VVPTARTTSTGTSVPSGAVAHSREAVYRDRSTFGTGVCFNSSLVPVARSRSKIDGGVVNDW